MECKRYERLMVDYLAGELTQKEAEALMVHLRICSDCARSFEEYKGVIAESKNIDIFIPDEYVWERKLAEIKTLQHRHIPILKPISAFAILLLVMSLFLIRTTKNGKEDIFVRISSKNGYGLVLTKLPYSENTILEKIDYIDEETASEILNIVLNTPPLPIYEY